MQEFLLKYNPFITNLVELFSACCGSWYLHKTGNQKLKTFVYYLWLTVLVENLGTYTYLLQNNYDFEWFRVIKNSVFCNNTWLYNIYFFLSVGLLGIFYSGLLDAKKNKLFIRVLFLIYCFFSLFYFVFTDAFFVMGLPYDSIIVATIITLYFIVYFLELINSEVILKFYKLPSFYISIGLLMWHLCVTPLFIFNGYYKAINVDFIQFRTLLLLFINIFTYSCFSFGFLYSLYKKT